MRGKLYFTDGLYTPLKLVIQTMPISKDCIKSIIAIDYDNVIWEYQECIGEHVKYVKWFHDGELAYNIEKIVAFTTNESDEWRQLLNPNDFQCVGTYSSETNYEFVYPRKINDTNPEKCQHCMSYKVYRGEFNDLNVHYCAETEHECSCIDNKRRWSSDDK